MRANFLGQTFRSCKLYYEVLPCHWLPLSSLFLTMPCNIKLQLKSKLDFYFAEVFELTWSWPFEGQWCWWSFPRAFLPSAGRIWRILCCHGALPHPEESSTSPCNFAWLDLGLPLRQSTICTSPSCLKQVEFLGKSLKTPELLELIAKPINTQWTPHWKQDIPVDAAIWSRHRPSLLERLTRVVSETEASLLEEVVRSHLTRSLRLELTASWMG